MSKITLNDLSNLQNENTAVTKINQNNHTIEQAFDNTISRDGSTPNQMQADFDMNNHDILNVKEITFPDDVTITQLPTATEVGSLIYRGPNNKWDVLPLGPNGSFLGSAGSGNPPVWNSSVGTGDMTKTVYDPSNLGVNVYDSVNQLKYTRSSLISKNIPASTTYLTTTGYSSVGDKGEASYKKVVSEPTHPGKFQSADGAWWELTAEIVFAEMFGAKGDGTTDDSAAINNAISYVSSKNGGVVQLLARSYFTSTNAIQMKSGVKLIGLGFGSNSTGYVTQISSTRGGSVIVNSNPSTLITRPVVKDILINAPSCTDYVIDAQSWSYFEITNNWIYGGGAGGIRVRSYTTSGTISGITKANPAVVTATGHPFVNGQSVYISGVSGMTQVNNTFFIVSNATANTFELLGVNSTGYGTYTSGGTVKSLNTDPTYYRIEGNQIGNALICVLLEDNSNSGVIRNNRIQPLTGGLGVQALSSYAGYPNNVAVEENWIETPSTGVTGVYVGSTCDGITVGSNRLELPGSGVTGITVVPGAVDVTLNGNYYSIPLGTKLSDTSNITIGSDRALQGARVQIDGATGNMISGTNFNVSATAIEASTPGKYLVSLATSLINTTRFNPKVICIGDVYPVINSFSTVSLEIICLDATGVVKAPTTLYVDIS